jgi:hypothetical protein
VLAGTRFVWIVEILSATNRGRQPPVEQPGDRHALTSALPHTPKEDAGTPGRLIERRASHTLKESRRHLSFELVLLPAHQQSAVSSAASVHIVRLLV